MPAAKPRAQPEPEPQPVVTVKFERAKETKNTWKYAEVVADGDPEMIGTLYLQKFFAKELGSPETITVTITAG